MPSPVAHSLAGLTLQALTEGRGYGRAALLASLADVDLLLERGVGYEGEGHGGCTHSVGAAAAAGLWTGFYERKRDRSFREGFVEGMLLYGSHLVLDFLGRASEDGMKLFWPFSNRRMASGWSWFRTIRSDRRRGFWKGLLIRHNADAIARELVVFLPLLLLAHRVRG